MKLRYLFATLVAALTIFAGCEKEADHYLEEVQVSSSYIAFPAAGGTQELTVTAIGDWSIKDLPEWISSSAMAGAQGESTVRLTATAAEETREDSFSIECAGKAQTVNVIQVTEKQEPVTLTVAEALEVIKPLQDQQVAGGTYRVKGIVCKITEISPQYGNATFYISDDGSYKGTDKTNCNWLQVYRGLWLNGSAFTTGDEFAVGDILTIEGSLMDYKGTPETKEKQAFVVSIEKSLIGIDSIELLGVEDGAGVTEFPKEGGSIKITLNNKGNGFHVVIPEEAKSWLHIEDFGPDYVTLSADANNAGARNATVSFTTSADGVAYSCEQAFSQLGAISELSIADFLAKESGDPSQYRLTGVITEDYASDSQGQSFYFRDWSDKTLVYRLNDYKASGATVGDIITVVGNRGDYKGSPQMVNGVYESHIATIKDKSLAEIAAAADANDVYYIATGTVKEIADEKWGNLWLSDGTTDLYVYGCYPGWGATGDNRHNQIANAGIKVGDKLSVIGIKTTFNDAPQIKNGVYFTHEAGEPAGGSITVDGNAADWEGIQGVASADCPAGAELTGIKSAKAYYGDKLYVLAEFSDEALAKGVADGKLRFHVFFSGADGLLSRFWADENIAYMMEGKATSGGSYTDFSSPLYKFTGATSADWSWDNSGVTPAVTSAGNGNIYEVAIDYSDYPGGFPEQVEIGIDCADGNYEVLGYAPQTSHKFVLKKGEVVDVPDDPTPGEKAPLFLNEFDTQNKQIEIYNAGDKDVDMTGWIILKNDGEEGEKDTFVIPAALAKISAKGYAVFTCKQSDAANGPLFGLSGSKGFKIALKNGDTVIDEVDNLTNIVKIDDGKSWGRETDGADNFVIFDTPTIGSANGAGQSGGEKGVATIFPQLTGWGNANATAYEATLDGAVVSYVNGNNVYIEDETGAILYYKKDHGLKAGDVLTGKVSGTGYLYNGLPEVVEIGTEVSVSGGGKIPETVVSVADLLANYDSYLSKRIKLEGVTVTDGLADNDRNGKVSQGGSEINLYSGYKTGIAIDEGKTGDLIAFPTVYQKSQSEAATKQLSIWESDFFTESSSQQDVKITIDGNFDDWADVPGAEPAAAFNAYKVTNDADNFYFYIETDPGSRLWSGGAYLYLYFNFTNDLTQGAYSGATGMHDNKYDAYIFMYLFGGSADAPVIEDNPNGGEAQGMTLDNIVIAGNKPATSSDIVKMEIVIPRANFATQVNSGDVIAVDAYRSKDGGNIYYPGYVVK